MSKEYRIVSGSNPINVQEQMNMLAKLGFEIAIGQSLTVAGTDANNRFFSIIMSNDARPEVQPIPTRAILTEQQTTRTYSQWDSPWEDFHNK